MILITTKRGQEGQAKIEVGMNATLKFVSQLPGSLHSADALMIRNQAAEQELGLKPDSWNKLPPSTSLRNTAILPILRRPSAIPMSTGRKRCSRTTPWPTTHTSTSVEVQALSSTSAAIDYLHEGDLFRQWDNNRGYKAGYGYDRINARTNLDFALTRTTTLKVNLFGAHGERKGPWGTATGSFGESQLWQAAYSAPRDAFIPRYSDGTWGYYPADTQGAPNSILNLALSGTEKHTTTRINTDFTLTQNLDFITKGLSASALVSWDNVFQEDGRGINDLYHNAQEKWIDPATGKTVYLQPQQGNTNFDFQEGILWTTVSGSVNNGATVRNLFYQAQLNYARKFGKHDVTAMGVFNRTENAYGATSRTIVRTGPSVPLITTTAATSLSTMVLTTVPNSSVPTIVSTGSTPVPWATRSARRSSSNRSRNMSTCSSSVTASARSVTTVPTSAAGSMPHSGLMAAARSWD